MIEKEWIYVGFWARVGASLIDTMLLLAITVPVVFAVYGLAYLDSTGLFAGPADVLIQLVAPALVVMAFWIYKNATPGKMAISAQVVDATTGAPLTPGQALGRYLGYFVSTIPLGLGLLWVAFDSKKQGWHDKLAHTVVIRKPPPHG